MSSPLTTKTRATSKAKSPMPQRPSLDLKNGLVIVRNRDHLLRLLDLMRAPFRKCPVPSFGTARHRRRRAGESSRAHEPLAEMGRRSARILSPTRARRGGEAGMMRGAYKPMSIGKGRRAGPEE